jgi:tocopherol O-methyltransferase
MATPAMIRQHYDDFAPIYRAFWGDHIHHGLFVRGDESPPLAQLAMLEHCAALVGIAPQCALDVGCGHGGTAIFLSQKFGAQVDGLTISSLQARIAEQNSARAGVSDRVRITVADVDRHHFPAAAYDVVWTMESSEHFHDRAVYFRNVARTLRPGGRLLVAAWTGDMRSQAVREVARLFLCPSLQDCASYVAQISLAGLSLVIADDWTAQVTRTWEICRARATAGRLAAWALPATIRDFVLGIDVILRAYRSGELRYSVIVAEKPAVWPRKNANNLY